jgi:hypothetical protein
VSSRTLSTPVAILLGSVVIALGVYFGLRAQRTDEPAPSAAPPQPSASPPPSPATARLRVEPKELDKLVAKALERQREQLHATCGTDGGTVTLTLDFRFDSDGSQRARGVREHRGTPAPELTACILKALPPLKLRPLGQPMKTSVELAFP